MINHLSYSQISHYLTCQRSYRYKYINEIATDSNEALLFGSAWHKMISKCLVGGYSQIAWAELTNGMYDFYGQGMNMLGSQSVQTALQGLKPLNSPMVDHEDGNRVIHYVGDPMIDYYVEFTVPHVPVPIIGYIDMVADDRVPVDFKTASRKWTQAQADQSLQPTFYLAGLHAQGFLKASDFPAKFRYIIFLKKSPYDVQIIETTRTASDVINMFGLVGECWQAIQNGTFLPTGAGSWKCSENYCDFWERCQGGMKDDSTTKSS